ncbi:MAG: helix-turn-helix domain-containing protein [Nanoarchaeota archaeon]
MIEELKFLGLGYYESKALEILLKQKLSLKELSKKSGIPFGKVYSVVKEIKKKGFVKETDTRPKLIYVENASDVLSKLIDEKQNKENLLIENVRKIAVEIDREKGRETKFFQIGTTQEENKKIQLRSFNEAKKEVLQILNIYHKPDSNRENKTLWERAIINATERGVIFK